MIRWQHPRTRGLPCAVLDCLAALTLAWYLALVAWVGRPDSQAPQLVLIRPIDLGTPTEPLVFRLLVEFPNRPTQLYALAGLYRTDAASYREFAARQRALGGSVETVVGCVASTVAINPLVDELDRGKWTTELLLGRLVSRELRLPPAVALTEVSAPYRWHS